MKSKEYTGYKKLQAEFYLRNNVLKIAEDLIGKFLVTKMDNIITSAMIIETEAYNGVIDQASHAYDNRRTKRNEIMYGDGGFAYVYLCYGIHHMFNVVTNKRDTPHAILIRAVIPMDGIDKILERRNHNTITKKTSDGPGTLSLALGIKTLHSGISLSGNLIWIEDRGIKFKKKEIIKSPRIGVDYAGEDALLHYRYRLNENIISDFYK
jgi:DNA-3-methyladenine glycosylase